MIKIEATTLEEAYTNAAKSLGCSINELNIEVIQSPSSGLLGMFRKKAVIVAAKKQTQAAETPKDIVTQDKIEITDDKTEDKIIEQKETKDSTKKAVEKDSKESKPAPSQKRANKTAKIKEEQRQTLFQDTIMPQSFVSMQDEDEDTHYEPVYADEDDEDESLDSQSVADIAKEVKRELNSLFETICFDLENIEVIAYDANTLLIEFKGEDAALLIGKEGYRYKALSYMLFNWINAKYQVGLRLEIAEFLKNQEEAVTKYLENVSEIVAKDGRAQTKILDGVLIQIALKELRDIYPDKYVAIRSTRDGLKYIIINDYHAK